MSTTARHAPHRRSAVRLAVGALAAAALVAGLAPLTFAGEPLPAATRTRAAPSSAPSTSPDPSPSPGVSPSPTPSTAPFPVPVGTVEQQVAAMAAAPLLFVGPDGFVTTADEDTLRSWLIITPPGTDAPSPASPGNPSASPDPSASLDPAASPAPAPPVAASVTVDGTAIARWLASYLDRYAVGGRNAGFRMDSKGRFVGVVPSRDGRGLDRAATARAAEDALSRRAASDLSNDVVAMIVGPARPPLTTEKAKAMMPKLRRISAWTTHWQVGENNGFGANIIIPARKIHGTLVMPGDVFDFWKVVGIPTPEQGYRAGGAIINGRSEPTGAFAGGICSTSTTIFNAAVRAGFQILSRVPHYYYIDRYPLGLDATVWMTGGSTQSVKWRNDSANPVFIRAVASPGIVTFELYSLPTGRTVTFSKPRVSGRVGARDVVEYTSSLPAGVAQRIEFPHEGMYVEVTRTVRDAEGSIVHREVWRSRYNEVDGRLLIGASGAPPTPKPAPAPGPVPGSGGGHRPL